MSRTCINRIEMRLVGSLDRYLEVLKRREYAQVSNKRVHLDQWLDIMRSDFEGLWQQ
ncbi:hypothetical protein AURDEDRAFT_163958 [Auricularia subglabra TFB-10046 SS5]|nr:hypothetical protein AURDEDRAFT_163958 [Auricularia subglabra TFB-10046 SS5]